MPSALHARLLCDPPEQALAETAAAAGKSVAETAALLAGCRERMFEARQQRPRPHRDEKVPCRAVLCCAVLCCAVLCCAVLRCAVPCCAVPCCAVLRCAVLRCVVPCCAMLCCTVQTPASSPLLASARHPCCTHAWFRTPVLQLTVQTLGLQTPSARTTNFQVAPPLPWPPPYLPACRLCLPGTARPSQPSPSPRASLHMSSPQPPAASPWRAGPPQTTCRRQSRWVGGG
jgi:hypothetical protein